MGYKLLAKLAEDVIDSGVVEFAPKQDGRNMVMVLAPVLKKASGQKPKTIQTEESLGE
jgi:translation initiation factor IF-3